MPCCFGGVEDQLEEDCAADRERKAEREEVSWTGETARGWRGARELVQLASLPRAAWLDGRRGAAGFRAAQGKGGRAVLSR